VFNKPNEAADQAGDSSTVKRILHNALDHFSRYGYTGASVREITHASQVTKPTLYYYFKNKEELFRKLSDSCFEEILGSLTSAAGKSGTTHDRALNVIREYCRLCLERYSVVRFVHLMAVAAERNTPDVGVKDFSRKIGLIIQDIVKEGVDRGEIEMQRSDALAYALNSIMVTRVTGLLIDKDSPIQPHEVVEQAVGVVLNKH
jgi:TetR/AcrR family transcriptional regulator, mexJK operon transcriptional repressor